MKTKFFSILSMFLLVASMVFAQEKTEKFEVKGNCGMCENRIEKAAKSVDGVTKANWNQETKLLHISFDESKTSVHKVQKAIAKVGHDTHMHKAKDEVYNALPQCCNYSRTEVKEEKEEKTGHEGHKH